MGARRGRRCGRDRRAGGVRGRRTAGSCPAARFVTLRRRRRTVHRMLPAPPGPFRPGFWRSPAARAVADRRRSARSCSCWSRSSRPPASSRTPRTCRTCPATRSSPSDRDLPLTVRLADRPELAVRAHAGPAHERRPDRDPVPAGQAVVGHPAAVRVAAGRRARREALERLSIALLVSSAVFQLATGVDQRAVLVPVQVQLRGRALLRRDRLRGVARAARDRQAAGDPARLPRARSRDARLDTAEPASTAAWTRADRSRAAGCSPSPARARCTLLLGNVGQSIGGPLRKLALLAPRRGRRLPGQQDRARRRDHARDDRRRTTSSCCASATA